MRSAWGVRDDGADAAGYDPRTGSLLPTLRRDAPWRNIALAAFLLATGFSLLVAGIALGAKGTPNAMPLTILGALMFVPGGYYVRVAYKAWRGEQGFSFDALPEL